MPVVKVNLQAALVFWSIPKMGSIAPSLVHLQACIATIVHVQQKHGVTATSLLNFVVSDGNALVATRFVAPSTENAASLYYAEGRQLIWSSTLMSCACPCNCGDSQFRIKLLIKTKAVRCKKDGAGCSNLAVGSFMRSGGHYDLPRCMKSLAGA
eukprot:scaffold227281_cov18-Tisochrysis_lutea.AAC.1